MMKTVSRFYRPALLSSAISAVLITLAWILFMPVQFGGNVSYVIINGNSMEPMLHAGDLVIIRNDREIQLGDVVTYEFPELGRVIHRIIGREGKKYILQGDNNDWVDGYQPVKNEITGKYWFSIPKAGKVLLKVRSPIIFSLVAGFSTFLLGVTMVKTPSQKRKTKPIMTKFLEKAGIKLTRWKDGYWFWVYFLAILFLVLGVFSFFNPTTKKVTDETPYTQKGLFSYSGFAGQNIYDTTNLQSGDPIFTTLTCNVKFGFSYLLSAQEPITGSGSYQINTILRSSNGWHRTAAQSQVIDFEGTSFSTEQQLNLCDFSSYLKSVEQITGTEGQQFSLDIAPMVEFDGKLSNQELVENFEPVLSFAFRDNQVVLVSENTESEVNPLSPVKEGILTTERLSPNTLNILGLRLPVTTGRLISIIGLLLAGIGLLVPYLVIQHAERNDEKLKARLLLGNLYVEINQPPVADKSQIVQVVSFEDLIQMAEKSESVILMHAQPDVIDYYIQKDDIFYHFRQLTKPPRLE